MIIDATDGTAWLYSGIGSGNCYQSTKATLENVFQQISVPWTDLGGGRIRLSLPGCAKAGGGTPAEGKINGPTTIEALGERRIAPCHSGPTTALATVNSPPTMDPWPARRGPHRTIRRLMAIHLCAGNHRSGA